MKKLLIALGIAFGILIFLYAALSALVNQGLNIADAVVVLLLVVLGGGALIWAVREN